MAAYLERRKISRKTAMNFGLGASLDQWDALLNAMLEKGYTKADLLAAGLVVSNQKGRIYDVYRLRILVCSVVRAVPMDATALSNPAWCRVMTSMLPSQRMKLGRLVFFARLMPYRFRRLL